MEGAYHYGSHAWQTWSETCMYDWGDPVFRGPFSLHHTVIAFFASLMALYALLSEIGHSSHRLLSRSKLEDP
jgi:hypothetical protein